MKFIETEFKGCYLIKYLKFKDERGFFVKTFHVKEFQKIFRKIKFQEMFYSTSKKGVIRGMHFQIPPYEHAKLVYVVSGEIIDVIVDIRKNSPTYKKYITLKLSETNANGVFIPPGFAHGFIVTSNIATVVYNTTKEYSKEHDTGIRWDSFEYDWKIKNPIISKRDNKLSKLKDFNSPF